MTVYVDPLMPWGQSATWRYNENCHMFADSDKELHALAKQIGLRRSWCQEGERYQNFTHYDLTKTKRALAVAAGAVEVDFEFMAAFWKQKRAAREAVT